ncbi:MAG TPA: NAD(P)/FAD-dependent oxidoreductase [Rhodothermales bacterium]|nr:NAD(P)/FAD-dependent oxidoreductase [Rhodothermales bacterium]
MPASRTPLFSALRRVARLAAARPTHAPPVDELIEMEAAAALSRRSFLRQAGAATAGLALLPALSACAPRLGAGAPRIAIVGAGLSGLNAAWKLRRAGYVATVYEASTRTGGRTYTASDVVAPGYTVELGGEFVDSTHADIFDLCEELGLSLVDRQAADHGRHTFFFGGRHHTEAEVVEAFRPLAARIQADYDSMGEIVDFENEGGATAFDRMSIAQYLDRIGASGLIRELLEVAYVTEYGLDVDEQSALNLVFLIGTDVSAGFQPFGDSDERYKVDGGNQRIADELAMRLDGQVRLGHVLESVRPRGEGVRLAFAGPGGAMDVEADLVLLTLPFTMLRQVEIGVELPDWKRRAINELGYGTNAKLFAGTNGRPWRELGYSAESFADTGYQLAWDHTETQGSSGGGLTLYSGGAQGIAVGEGTAEAQVARLMPGVEQVFPGTQAALNGLTSRFHWPSHPWTQGSYAAFRPGQWTTIAGAEIKPVGPLYFAGEHCSYEFQGYMNGAAETGRRAAQVIFTAMGRPSMGAVPRIPRRAEEPLAA